MKLPKSIAIINAELGRRYAAGQPIDIVDFEFKPMVDDDIGIFARCTVHFADGNSFIFDSTEMSLEMRMALQQRAMQ